MADEEIAYYYFNGLNKIVESNPIKGIDFSQSSICDIGVAVFMEYYFQNITGIEVTVGVYTDFDDNSDNFEKSQAKSYCFFDIHIADMEGDCFTVNRLTKAMLKEVSKIANSNLEKRNILSEHTYIFQVSFDEQIDLFVSIVRATKTVVNTFPNSPYMHPSHKKLNHITYFNQGDILDRASEGYMLNQQGILAMEEKRQIELALSYFKQSVELQYEPAKINSFRLLWQSGRYTKAAEWLIRQNRCKPYNLDCLWNEAILRFWGIEIKYNPISKSDCLESLYKILSSYNENRSTDCEIAQMAYQFLIQEHLYNPTNRIIKEYEYKSNCNQK